MRLHLLRVLLRTSHSTDQELLDDVEAARVCAPNTTEFQTQPPLQAAFLTWFSDGDAFKAAIADVAQKEAAAAKARTNRDEKRAECRKSQNLCGNFVQKMGTNAAHVASFGMKLFERVVSSLIVLPVKIDPSYDANLKVINIRITFADGKKHDCAIEVTTTPNDPASWKRLEGTGMHQQLLGYAPCTLWIRVCTLRAKKESPWFGPESVIVR